MFQSQEAGVTAARHMAAAFWSAAASAQAAGVTIALRTPILMQAALDPFAWPARREAVRAATEKWEAGVEGALAASFASARLWADMVTRPGDMRALADGIGKVQKAALRPARIRVRGNAKRLSRKRG